MEQAAPCRPPRHRLTRAYDDPHRRSRRVRLHRSRSRPPRARPPGGRDRFPVGQRQGRAGDGRRLAALRHVPAAAAAGAGRGGRLRRRRCRLRLPAARGVGRASQRRERAAYRRPVGRFPAAGCHDLCRVVRRRAPGPGAADGSGVWPDRVRAGRVAGRADRRLPGMLSDGGAARRYCRSSPRGWSRRNGSPSTRFQA